MQSSITTAAKINRRALQGINHQNSISCAEENYVQACTLNNRQGQYRGNIRGKVSSFDNRNGILVFGSGVSHLNVHEFITDRFSSLEGPGSLSLSGTSNFIGYGKVNIGGGYYVHGSGDMIFNQNIQASSAYFETNGYVTNTNSIQISQQGGISAFQFFNQGFVQSQGSYTIEQKIFNLPQNVVAYENLILKSSSPICIQNPINLAGGLTLISPAYVKTFLPLNINGNFEVRGSDILFYQPIIARGQGIFRSLGQLNFDHTYARFGNGINAQVDRFCSQVSTIESFGVSRILCREFWLSSEVKKLKSRNFCPFISSSLTYKHFPSTFRQKGDLYLEVASKAVNDASHFLVDGNLWLVGEDFENRNRHHEHIIREKVGKCAKKIGPIKVGSTTLYAERRELVIDGVANTQIKKTLYMQLAGTLYNDGVINTSKIHGNVNHLINGSYNHRALIPTRYSQAIESLNCAGHFRPGGDIRSEKGMYLKVHDLLKNSGFIEANGPISYIEVQRLENEKSLAKGTEQAIKVKTWVRHSKRNLNVDYLNPGGEIRGGHLTIQVEKGCNVGGIIEGLNEVHLCGGGFDNKALRLNKVIHLNPGNPLPWKTRNAYSVRTDFKGALINSGGKLNIDFKDRFFNEGSDTVSWDSSFIRAGEIIQRTLFSSYLSTSKRGPLSGKNLHTIVMREGSMQALQGDLNLISTIGNVDIEGKVGSYLENVNIESATDILFSAQTMSKENKVKETHLTPATLTTQITTFNTSQTSLPFLFSGKNSTLKARQNVIFEEIQAHVKRDFTIFSEGIYTVQHKVENYQRIQGLSLGLTFFGSQALESLYKRESLKTVKSLLKEDPAIASLFNLASSKIGSEKAMYSLMAVATTWNEISDFAKGKTLGQHLSLTHSQGNFQPQITARLGFFEQTHQYTTIFAPNFVVGRNLHFNANKQSYSLEMKIGAKAKFVGKNILWRAKEQNIRNEGSSFGISFGFDARGINIGADGAHSEVDIKNYHNANVEAGTKIKIQADCLDIQGAKLEADVIKVKAQQLNIETMANTMQGNQQGYSVSTTGTVSFARSKQRTSNVPHVSGIRARSSGSVNVNNLNLRGGAIQNIAIKTKNIHVQDIQEHELHESFETSFNLQKFNEIGQGRSSQGLTILGSFNYKKEQRNGLTHALDGLQEKKKTKKHQAALPFIAFDKNQILNEASEIGETFAKKKNNTLPITPPPSPIIYDLAVTDTTTATISKKVTTIQKKIKTDKAKASFEEKEIPLSKSLKEENSLDKNEPHEIQPSVLDFWGTNQRKEEMLEVESVAFLMDLTADALIWGAAKACAVHPKVQNKCHQAKELSLKSIDWLKRRTPTNWKIKIKELLQYREQITEFNISEEQRLHGVEPSLSYNYYQSLDNIAINILLNIPLGATPLPKTAKMINPWASCLYRKSTTNKNIDKIMTKIIKNASDPSTIQSIYSHISTQRTLDENESSFREFWRINQRQEEKPETNSALILMDLTGETLLRNAKKK